MSNPLSTFLFSAENDRPTFNGTWKLQFNGQFLHLPSINPSAQATPAVTRTSNFDDATSFKVEASPDFQKVGISVATSNSSVRYYLRPQGPNNTLVAAPFDQTQSWLTVQDLSTLGCGYFALQTVTGGMLNLPGAVQIGDTFSAIKICTLSSKTTTPPSAVIGDLGVAEVALFTDPKYGNQYTTGKVFIVSCPVTDTSVISGLDDSISSVLLGPMTAIALYSSRHYSGSRTTASTSLPQLSNHSVGDNALTSFEMWAVPAPTVELAAGQAILYQQPNFQGLSRLFGPNQTSGYGDHENIYCRNWRSMRVGPRTMATLYSQLGAAGSWSSVYADITDFDDSGTNGAVQGCPKSLVVIDLDLYYSGTGQFQGYAETHQFPNYCGQSAHFEQPTPQLGVPVQSIRLNQGFGVTFYSGANYTGTPHWIADNSSNLTLPFQPASMRPWNILDPDQNSYVTADALLMQDYWQPDLNAPLEEKRVYRLCIKPLQFAAGMRVTIGALETVDIGVGGASQTIPGGSEVDFPLDRLGQLTVSIDANQKLTTSPLRVRTSNMPEDSYVVLFPDEQVHRSLADVTADDLPEKITGDDNRSALASTISNLGASIRQNYGSASLKASNPPGRTVSVRLTGGGAALRTIDTGGLPSWSLSFSGASASYAPLGQNQTRDAADTVSRLAPQGGQVFNRAGSDAWNQLMANPSSIQNITFYTNDGNSRERGVLSDLWHKLVVIVETAAQEFVSFVLDTVEAVGDFIVSVLQKAGLLISEVIDWVSALFDWTYIQQVQSQLSSMIDDGLTTVIQEITILKDELDSMIDTEASALNNAINDMIGQLTPDTRAATIGKAGAPVEQAHQQFAQNSVQLDWGKTAFSDHAGNLQTSVPAFAVSAQQEGVWRQFDQQLSTDVDRDQAQGTFSTALAHVHEIFSNPPSLDQILNIGLVELLTAVKDLTSLALKVAKHVVDTLLDNAQWALQQVQTMMRQELTIPVLSGLYQSISNGGALTFLDLTTLLVAIPTAVGTKLLNSGAASIGADRATRAVEAVNPMILLAAMANSIAVIGPSDAYGDWRDEIPDSVGTPQPPNPSQVHLEFALAVVNIVANAGQLVLAQQLSGRTMADLFTFHKPPATIYDDPAGWLAFYQSLSYCWQWSFACADAISVVSGAGRNSYRLLRNQTLPPATFPIGALIHSSMAMVSLVLLALKSGARQQVINSENRTSHDKSLLTAATWVEFTGEFFALVPDMMKIVYKIIIVPMEANIVSVVIDEAGQVIYAILLATAKSLEAAVPTED